MSKRNIRKSASTSFQVHRHVNSSSSETSTSSSSSDNSDAPLKRFNRLLRSSVARRWTFFRRQQPSLRSRGRSVSDAGLCTIVDHDLGFLDIPVASARRSLQVIDTTNIIVPTLSITAMTAPHQSSGTTLKPDEVQDAWPTILKQFASNSTSSHCRTTSQIRMHL